MSVTDKQIKSAKQIKRALAPLGLESVDVLIDGNEVHISAVLPPPRKWARRKTVKVGDVLECDGGFTCMRAGDRKIVKAFKGELKHCDPGYAKDPFARLYVECSEGCHSLDGQLNTEGELVGLYPA